MAVTRRKAGRCKLPVQREFYDFEAVVPLAHPRARLLSVLNYSIYFITFCGSAYVFASRSTEFEQVSDQWQLDGVACTPLQPERHFGVRWTVPECYAKFVHPSAQSIHDGLYTPFQNDIPGLGIPYIGRFDDPVRHQQIMDALDRRGLTCREQSYPSCVWSRNFRALALSEFTLAQMIGAYEEIVATPALHPCASFEANSPFLCRRVERPGVLEVLTLASAAASLVFRLTTALTGATARLRQVRQRLEGQETELAELQQRVSSGGGDGARKRSRSQTADGSNGEWGVPRVVPREGREVERALNTNPLCRHVPAPGSATPEESEGATQGAGRAPGRAASGTSSRS